MEFTVTVVEVIAIVMEFTVTVVEFTVTVMEVIGYWK